MIAFLTGDVCEQLNRLPAECFDSLLSDFPYGLSSEPDIAEVMRHWLAQDLQDHVFNVSIERGVDPPTARTIATHLFPIEPYRHNGGGFMGKVWDSFVPGPEVWQSIYRVLKPGAWGAVFGSTRTFGLLEMGARIAGFSVRDTFAWVHGQGMPKTRNVALDIDKAAGVQKGHRGAAFSVAGLGSQRSMKGKAGAVPEYRSPPGAPGEPYNGRGTAVRPGFEPILIVRKPLRGTLAANVQRFDTGMLMIDPCRLPAGAAYAAKGASIVGNDSPRTLTAYGKGNIRRDTTHPGGRWPANIYFDSETYPAEAVDKDGHRYFYCAKVTKGEREAGLTEAGAPLWSGGQLTGRVDGQAGLNSPRAGAGRGGGRRNPHPTMKPLGLLEYIARLVTPPGGTVCVPFSGVGSEVISAARQGFHAVGIELDPESTAIAKARAGHWLQRPDLTTEARAWWDARRQALAAVVGWLREPSIFDVSRGNTACAWGYE